MKIKADVPLKDVKVIDQSRDLKGLGYKAYLLAVNYSVSLLGSFVTLPALNGTVFWLSTNPLM